MNLPRVSLVCPTFNRAATQKELLEETIHSFLQQDYQGEKELIVLNDNKYQAIHFKHPEVRVVNLQKRFPTLGEKYNYGFSIASGTVFADSEDDDFYLKNHISKGVEELGDAPVWNPGGYWFMDGRGLHHDFSMGVCHNCSFFTKEAFNKVGGYPAATGNQDAIMNGNLLSLIGAKKSRLTPKERTYGYRFGVSPIHLSGCQNPQLSYDKYAQKSTQRGNFYLAPHWSQPYDKLIQDYLRENNLT